MRERGAMRGIRHDPNVAVQRLVDLLRQTEEDVGACLALDDLLRNANAIDVAIDLGCVEAVCKFAPSATPSDVRHPLGLLLRLFQSRTSCMRRAVGVVPVLLDMLVDPRYAPFASAPAAVLNQMTGARATKGLRAVAARHDAVRTLSAFLNDVLPLRVAGSHGDSGGLHAKSTLINLVSFDHPGRSSAIDAVLSQTRLPRVVLAAARAARALHQHRRRNDRAAEKGSGDDEAEAASASEAEAASEAEVDAAWLRATEVEAARIRAAEAEAKRRAYQCPPVLRAIRAATRRDHLWDDERYEHIVRGVQFDP